MKKLRVYLETSFFSYLTGHQTSDRIIAMRQAETRLWWEREAQLCDLFVSGHVLLECADGNREQAAKRIDAAKPIPELDGETTEVRELAEKLIAAHALPEKEVTDALHIATAAVHSMDYLLTWNCRHMANPHTLPLTREIVETAGYRCPAIITPSGFMELTEKGGDQ